MTVKSFTVVTRA